MFDHRKQYVGRSFIGASVLYARVLLQHLFHRQQQCCHPSPFRLSTPDAQDTIRRGPPGPGSESRAGKGRCGGCAESLVADCEDRLRMGAAEWAGSEGEEVMEQLPLTPRER